MRRWLLLSLLVVIPASFAQATTYLDWADDFVSGRVLTRFQSPTITTNFVNHSFTGAYSWASLGAQSRAGRGNAVEHVANQFTDWNTSACATQTVTLQRFRTNAVGAVGTSCDAQPGALIATAVKSTESCGGRKTMADITWAGDSLRLNFATESSQTGWVGYRSRITSNGVVAEGCYSIYWME